MTDVTVRIQRSSRRSTNRPGRRQTELGAAFLRIASFGWRATAPCPVAWTATPEAALGREAHRRGFRWRSSCGATATDRRSSSNRSRSSGRRRPTPTQSSPATTSTLTASRADLWPAAMTSPVPRLLVRASATAQFRTGPARVTRIVWKVRVDERGSAAAGGSALARSAATRLEPILLSCKALAGHGRRVPVSSLAAHCWQHSPPRPSAVMQVRPPPPAHRRR